MGTVSEIARAATLSEDDIDFDAYMRATEGAAKVKPAASWVESILQARNDPQGVSGATLPWGKTHHDIRLRPGEMSIWAGVNGHGKSLLLGQVMQSLAVQRQRVLIASFEMKPHDTVSRMLRQAGGGADYTDAFARRWAQWSRDWIWLYNQRGQTNAERVYAVCKYGVDELGIQHVVIDSLMKIVRAEDDYNGQKAVIDTLFSIAQDTGLHVHLVHHMRKTDDESKPGGKFGLKGSGSISDQVDNVFVVWKNKAKQQDRTAGKEVDESKPDALLICEKQRNGEFEGKIALWFHGPSQQFVAHEGGGPMPIVPEPQQ